MNIDARIPIRWYETALNQSRLANKPLAVEYSPFGGMLKPVGVELDAQFVKPVGIAPRQSFDRFEKPLLLAQTHEAVGEVAELPDVLLSDKGPTAKRMGISHG